MTAKAGSRGHVRWAGRMTSCVMTHDLAMPAECTGRFSTFSILAGAGRGARRLAIVFFFFFFFFWRGFRNPGNLCEIRPCTEAKIFVWNCVWVPYCCSHSDSSLLFSRVTYAQAPSPGGPRALVACVHVLYVRTKTFSQAHNWGGSGVQTNPPSPRGDRSANIGSLFFFFFLFFLLPECMIKDFSTRKVFFWFFDCCGFWRARLKREFIDDDHHDIRSRHET